MTKQKNNITIADLAKAIGTSPSTVSRALKNHPKISDDMKKRVRETALRMGYLQSKQDIINQNFDNNTIGVIVPTLSQSKYTQMIEAIRQVLSINGYRAIITCSNESAEEEKKIIDLFLSLNVKGIILSLTYMDKRPDVVSELIGIKPLVLIDRISFDVECTKVITDHFQAGYRATQHLLNNNYKRIAHIGGHRDCPLVKQISAGYKSAIRNSELDVDVKKEIFSDHITEDIIEATGIIFGQKIKPDAVLVDDIFAAQKLISILQTHKVIIPDDIGVIALSDERDYSFLSSGITTIQLPYYKMGKRAAEIILKEIGSQETSSKLIVETFYLNIKNSTLRK